MIFLYIGSGGDAHFYDDNQAPSKVRSNLSSNKDGDKVKGKQLIHVLLVVLFIYTNHFILCLHITYITWK